MNIFLRTDPGSDSLILITHLSIFLQQGRARLLKRSCSRVAASENEFTSDSECCIWKNMLFQPSVTKSCSLMGEQDFTLVVVSLDLLLPLIFSLSLSLHLLLFFSSFVPSVGFSAQTAALPWLQRFQDGRTRTGAAFLKWGNWQIFHTIKFWNLTSCFFPKYNACAKWFLFKFAELSHCPPWKLIYIYYWLWSDFMWYGIREQGSTVCRWCHCVQQGWLPANLSAGNDSTADNKSFLSNICHQSPSTCCNRSFLHLLPFSPSSSLPNCWNSPVMLSLSLSLSLTCFLPSSLFESLSFHHVSCLPYFVNPAHGEKKKKSFLLSDAELGHHPPLTPHTRAHHRLSPTPLHLSIKHLSSLICSIQFFPDCFHHFFPLPAAKLFRNKEGNLQ